jgi:cell division septation protein DedD
VIFEISPIHTVKQLGARQHMITIKPSSVTDDAGMQPEVAPDTPATEEHKKRIPLVWIPATLGVGLLIAVIYLGGRIVKGHPAAEPRVAHLATPLPVLKPLAQSIEPPPAPTPKLPDPQPEPLTAVTPDDGIPMITPQAGEMYIQVGALDQEATRRFVQRLRHEQLEPHVATGPTPQLMRVLIGPFDDRDALNARKAQLESEGVDTFVRQY